MTSSPSTLVRTALPAALAVFLFQGWYVHGWMLDDAFIFFRYAENWVAGHGPVYNPGETVEGYTSFLWLALLTLGHACGANVVVLSQVLGYVAALVCLLMVHQSHRFLHSVDRSASALATVFLASSAAFAVWAGSGMETSLSALLILATVLAHIRALEQDNSPRRWAGVGLLCALCTMNRPDALLVVVVLLLHLAWRRQDGYRAFRMLLGTFVLVFGAYYAWRFAYYGYPLPNTFYVRVGSTWSQVVRGLLYLGLFLIAALPLVVSCFCGVSVPQSIVRGFSISARRKAGKRFEWFSKEFSSRRGDRSAPSRRHRAGS